MCRRVVTSSGSAGSAAARTPPPTEARLLEQVAAGGNECSPPVHLLKSPHQNLSDAQTHFDLAKERVYRLRQVGPGNRASAQGESCP